MENFFVEHSSIRHCVYRIQFSLLLAFFLNCTQTSNFYSMELMGKPSEKVSSDVPSEGSREQKERPKILFRSFSVDPECLSLEFLKQALVPGSIREGDSTKIEDENEKGVYMSTNERVAEIYAHTKVPSACVKVPQCKLGGSVTNVINLPVCGILVEIGTDGLPVRRPRITATLQGHYNNGFQGEEWIADSVPRENFRIKKFFLSKGFGNSESFDVSGMSDDEVSGVIDSIQKKFENEKREAMALKRFIESLPERERYDPFLLKKFEKYKSRT